MRQFYQHITVLVLFTIFSASAVHAGQDRVIRDFLAAANQLLVLIEQSEAANMTGLEESPLRAELGRKVEQLQVNRLLLDERLRRRALKVEQGNSQGADRHAAFASRLSAQLTSLDGLLPELLRETKPSAQTFAELARLLRQLQPATDTPLHGSLPYSQLALAAVAPRQTPILVPAYRMASSDYLPADLQTEAAAPLSQLIYQQALAIATAAGKENWDPVDLYQWVKNNIRTEWYWGSMKGAEETLRQKSGNDADQAALLIALLRAAGYPSRYVRGVAEFFPDLSAARRLTGIQDAEGIGDFFRKAGIPCQPVLDGAQTVNYRIEHIWVETLIPYANYRGAMADNNGKQWLPLDTSFKVAAFQEQGALDLYAQSAQPLTGLRDEYLNSAGARSPLELVQDRVSGFLAEHHPTLQYNSLLHRRIAQQEHLEILSTALQFNDLLVTGEYSVLPDELMHTLQLSAISLAGERLPLFDFTLPVRELSNQPLQVAFEAATVEDQETINLWGGLDNTPAYLVRLRPVLLLNGRRLAAGQNSLAAGEALLLRASLRSPSASVEVENRLQAGYPHLFAVVAGDISSPPEADPGSPALALLHRTAQDYIDRWNRAEQEFAELLNLALSRPLPSLVNLGGTLDVATLLDQPQQVSWTGLFLDADLRAVEAVSRGASDDDRLTTFMQLSALQGSALEQQVLEENFQVASISTSNLFALARTANIPILTLNADNLAEQLPLLTLNPLLQEDISAAVNAGMQVLIPAEPITTYAWRGTGYLKEFVQSGDAGYMLSGAIAGGHTVLGRDFWPEEILRKMTRPCSGEPNNDPLAAHSLSPVTPMQNRLATAGEELPALLMVQVHDESGVPVLGAPVTFSVQRGGGSLLDTGVEPPLRVQSLIVQSDYDGIARARFIPGESVYSNPLVVSRFTDQEANIVGENLIGAQLAGGSQAALADPLIVLAFAGPPQLAQTEIVGDGRNGEVLSYAGNVGLFLHDRFANPVANHTVQFQAQAPLVDPASACLERLAAETPRQATLIAIDEPCLKQLPVAGECPSAAASITLKSRSDGSAMVGVVLGGAADADYPIVATMQSAAEADSQLTIRQHAAGNGACGLGERPVDKLILNYPRVRGDQNRNVDARPAGSLAKLRVKSYLLSEGAGRQTDAELVSCTPDATFSCDQMVGNGAFSILAPDQVTGNGLPLQRAAAIAGSSAMPYLYDLEMTLAEGLNQIPLAASASLQRTVIDNSCTACGPAVDQQLSLGPVEEVVEIWGVSLQLPESFPVAVDEQGRLLRDSAFSYSIRPTDYVANMAQLLIYTDGQLSEALLAATSGDAQLSLPAGYLFSPGKRYEIQLLLGNSGDANAIESDKVPVLPVTSRVSLQVDGLPEAVEDQVGAFVLLNNDYDKYEQGTGGELSDMASPGMISSDDEIKRAWIHIDDTDMLGGSWQLQADNPQQLRIYYEQGGNFVELPADAAPLQITTAPLTLPIYLEGIAESARPAENSLILSYRSSRGDLLSDSVPLTVARLDMAVDGDRDRKIDFATTADESATFWVNNDRDELIYNSGDDQNVEDDIDSGVADALDNRIDCKRDLEDFARLQIETGIPLDAQRFSYSLELIAQDSGIQPLINIFPAASETEAYLGFSNNDLPETSDLQLQKPLLAAVGAEPVSLPAGLLAANQITPLLYEGRADGRGQLLLTARYLGVPVLQRSVSLALWDMSYFYDHYIVEESGDPDQPVNLTVNDFSSPVNASRRALYQPSSDEYLLFVHGWNVEPWLKRRWAETIFKRLWWQGYQGRVGLFDWPTKVMGLPSWDFTVNFDRSEFLAWHSARALQKLLVELGRQASGQLRLLAHSLGNVVAGEALNLAEAGTVHSYLASQAALSASFYEADLPEIQPPLATSLLLPLPDNPPPLDSSAFETADVFSAYPPDAAQQPYLAGVAGKTGALLSYFNLRDYALTGDNLLSPRWEVNNLLKPDDTLHYGYQGDNESYPPPAPAAGFYQDRVRLVAGVEEPYRQPLTFPGNNYEIFAFAAESRSRALGAARALPAFLPEASAPDMQGARDLSLQGYNEKRYSHSRQFRSNIVDEQPYWSHLFTDLQFNGSSNN